MLKKLYLLLFAVAGLGSMPGIAQAADCSMEPTVQSLQACVQHGADMGAIDNGGIATSLLAQLHSAELVLARDNPHARWTTINVLGAFIGEVEAQAGKHIDAEHAKHIVMHAQMVIDALRTGAT